MAGCGSGIAAVSVIHGFVVESGTTLTTGRRSCPQLHASVLVVQPPVTPSPLLVKKPVVSSVEPAASRTSAPVPKSSDSACLQPPPAPLASRSHSGPNLTLAAARDSADASSSVGEPTCLDAPCLEVLSARSARSPNLRRLIQACHAGLCAGQAPLLQAEGMGGTYLLRGPGGERLAMFKPLDEEQWAVNNPKGFVGAASGSHSVRVGECAAREVAACLLDHGHWARVPRTALVRITHPQPLFHGQPARCDKTGSLQAYVRHDFDASEHGAGAFPAAQVHRLGVLDLRLYNTDRHTGNILVARAGGPGAGRGQDAPPPATPGGSRWADDAVQLIPIDHGFCLPDALEAVYFEWLHWPQASLPFSADTLAYIQSLDGDADAALLARELPALPRSAGRLVQLTTAVLQRGAAAGLCLADIGALMSRPLVRIGEEPSAMEGWVEHALAAAAAGGGDEEEEAGGSPETRAAALPPPARRSAQPVAVPTTPLRRASSLPTVHAPSGEPGSLEGGHDFSPASSTSPDAPSTPAPQPPPGARDAARSAPRHFPPPRTPAPPARAGGARAGLSAALGRPPLPPPAPPPAPKAEGFAGVPEAQWRPFLRAFVAALDASLAEHPAVLRRGGAAARAGQLMTRGGTRVEAFGTSLGGGAWMADVVSRRRPAA